MVLAIVLVVFFKFDCQNRVRMFKDKEMEAEAEEDTMVVHRQETADQGEAVELR